MIEHGKCFLFALTLLCLAAGAAAEATADPVVLSTKYHPIPSYLTLDFFIGDQDDPFAVPLGASIGPLAISGTMTASIQLDGAGSGTLELLGTNLVFQSATGMLDFGAQGSLNYGLHQVGFDFVVEPKSVTNHAFSFPFDATTTLTLNQGVMEWFDPTGVLDTEESSPYFPWVDDYDANPLTALPGLNVVEPLTGQVDSGLGLASPNAEIQLTVASFATPLVPLGDGMSLWLRYRGQINSAVPEPSSGLLAIGAIIIGAVASQTRRRRRNQSDNFVNRRRASMSIANGRRESSIARSAS